MTISRPDLSAISPEVRAYIEALEAELARLRRPAGAQKPYESTEPEDVAAEPSEPPTTFNLITISAGGWIKRTPRHLYGRQRRGGMGVFDLDAPEEDAPAFLAIADQNQTLVLVTSQGRAFPLSVSQLAESPIRARGELLSRWLPFMPNERLAAIFPAQENGYLILVTLRGQVRRLRYHYFRNLQPGTILYDIKEGGAPGAWCWSSGDGDLFIATTKGNAIRFAEIQVPVRGCLGIRMDPDDAVIGVASVREESGVFLLSADGRGTTRLMTGFTKNKEPGSGGKLAMKADRLVAATAVNAGDDIFAISRLSKLIRFSADEVPGKEGVVQGVNCMALRGDECITLVACPGYTAVREAGDSALQRPSATFAIVGGCSSMLA
jgi:DNA gyrase subunit A